MKAAQLTKFGDSDAIAINSIQKPGVSDGKVLIEVHAAGVNPVDWKIRSGMMKIPLPATLGGDFSGVVKEIGMGVTDFKPGDEVYGQAAAYAGGGSGSFEEFALAGTGTIAMKPRHISHIEAGALPLAGASALQALESHIKLAKGQHILIHGGGGGIGSIAIQIAKHIGARVSTTVSDHDIAYAKSLGADTIIDFHEQKFEEIVKNCDAVLDLVGGDTYRRSFKTLKRGGVIVSLVENTDEALMKQFGVTSIYQGTRVTTERLVRLAELVDKGSLKVHVDKIFPLEKAGDALAYLEKRHPRGKVVLNISETVH